MGGRLACGEEGRQGDEHAAENPSDVEGHVGGERRPEAAGPMPVERGVDSEHSGRRDENRDGPEIAALRQEREVQRGPTCSIFELKTARATNKPMKTLSPAKGSHEGDGISSATKPVSATSGNHRRAALVNRQRRATLCSPSTSTSP